MNALYKTLGLSACALLVFKFAAWPASQDLRRAHAQLQQALEHASGAQRMLDFALALPQQPVNLLGPDQALAMALHTLQTKAPDHGIKVTQVVARDVPITQQVFATSGLRQADAGTDTLSQKLLIKCSYIDLMGLRSFLKDVISPSKAMVVSDLSIKGDAVEIGLAIHSSKSETP